MFSCYPLVILYICNGSLSILLSYYFITWYLSKVMEQIQQLKQENPNPKPSCLLSSSPPPSPLLQACNLCCYHCAVVLIAVASPLLPAAASTAESAAAPLPLLLHWLATIAKQSQPGLQKQVPARYQVGFQLRASFFAKFNDSILEATCYHVPSLLSLLVTLMAIF